MVGLSDVESCSSEIVRGYGTAEGGGVLRNTSGELLRWRCLMVRGDSDGILRF